MLEKLNNVYIGLVVNNKDPKGRGRVQVFIPNITNTLYKNWNENTKDIKFRTLDSDIFNPETTQRLIDVLPWSEVTMPFFGGGTGAPVNTQTNEPRPIPTDPVVSSPGEYMVSSGSSSSNSSPNYVDNVLKGSNGGTTRLDIPSSGTADSRFLNQEFAKRLNGLYKDLSDAGYTVTLNSGFRAPTEAIKKQLGSSGSSQEVLFAQNPNPKAVAPPGKSKHDSGIAADLTVVGNGKYGNVNIHTISVANNDKNTVTPEYFSLLAKHGLQRPMSWENWHLEPVETQGRSKEEAAALLTTNYNANPNLDNAISTTAAQTGAMPEKNGINNTSATVSNESSGTLKLASDRQAKFSEELKNPETMKALSFLAKYEVGDDPIDQQAWMETVVNRAQFRGKSLSFELIDNVRYWGGWGGDYRASAEYKKFSEKDSPEFKSTLNKVINGSNLTNLATDNASNQPGNTLADNKIASGVTGSWMKNGIVVPAGTKGAEFLYRDKPFEKEASEYAKENGIIADSGQTPQPQKLNMICSSFNNNNVGSGMSSIGSAGGPIGMFSIPQVGAKAYIMFLDGNPLQPIVLGSFQDPSNVG